MSFNLSANSPLRDGHRAARLVGSPTEQLGLGAQPSSTGLAASSRPPPDTSDPAAPRTLPYRPVLDDSGTILLVWTLGLPRAARRAGALWDRAAYVLAVGWQPSVVRAGVAGGLASLAWLASRPRDRWYFLLVGAAVLLAWNPYSLLEPGFQLSFSAVAAIFVLVPRISGGSRAIRCRGSRPR